jgi:anti-sigma factor RsiW
MKEFNDITLQKIEDYVMDRLDPTERTLFETELATNAELRE